MMLKFPNPSRTYDATRHAVRFWGHDSAMERSFFVTEAALRRISNDALVAEREVLAAFDRHRNMICNVAIGVYGRGPKGSYDLDVDDF